MTPGGSTPGAMSVSEFRERIRVVLALFGYTLFALDVARGGYLVTVRGDAGLVTRDIVFDWSPGPYSQYALKILTARLLLDLP